MRLSVVVLFALTGGAVAPVLASAQDIQVSAIAGTAVPVSKLADRSTAGPLAGLSVQYAPVTRRLGVRADVEATWLNGRAEFSDIRFIGAQLFLVAGPRTSGAIRPYVLVGGGPYWRSGAAERVPSSDVTLGIAGGGGVAVRVGRVTVAAEARLQWHSSPYGSGEFSQPTYWPVGLRVTF